MGASALATIARAHGLGAHAGGLTWERRPIDPLPGPRRLEEVVGAQRLHEAAALAGPGTTGPGGFLFAESHMARVLGEPTVLIDPNGGPAVIAAGIAAAAGHLGCDLVVLLDVGGDVLAHGDEPGLASPLADAVVLAAAPALAADGTRCVGAIFGAGCDGELTPDEVAERLAEIAAAGGDLGFLELDQEALTQLATAVDAAPTEASAMALRCARGETGRATIRNGRREVLLTPLGGRIALYDPIAALASAARLAAAVRDAGSLAEADGLLAALGVRTELAYERDAAAGGG